MKAHWAADVFPLNEADIERLAESIKEQGQLEPIRLTQDGLIIDGRNRWLACEKLGVEPVTTTLPAMSEAQLVNLAWALNGDRRDLTKSQRACSAAETLEHMKENGELKRGGDKKSAKAKNQIQEVGKDSNGEISTQFKVNPESIRQARQLLREAPSLYAQVKSGDMTVSSAMDALQAGREVQDQARVRNSLASLRSKDAGLAEDVESGRMNLDEAGQRLAKREAEEAQRKASIRKMADAISLAAGGIEMVFKETASRGFTLRDLVEVREAFQIKSDPDGLRFVITTFEQLLSIYEEHTRRE